MRRALPAAVGLLVAVAAALGFGGAAATACSLSIERFGIVATGRPLGHARYSVDVRGVADADVAARFVVNDANGALRTEVFVPILHFHESTVNEPSESFVFSWPTVTLTAITAKEIIRLDDGTRTPCGGRAMAIATAAPSSTYDDNGEQIPTTTVMAAEWTPSDSAQLPEAKFISRIAPVYPAAERAAGHAGTTIVAVTIGPAGDLKDAKVLTSSGYAALDDAALAAARASSYARLPSGSASNATFQIEYRFTL